jgi:type IV secretory pathway TrbF-like protein
MSETTYPLSPPADLWPEQHRQVAATLQALQDRETTLLLRVRNQWWAIGGLTLLGIVLAGGLVHVADNKQIIPYLYQLAADGTLTSAGALQRGWKGDTTPPIEAAVKQWLYWMRRIGSDQVLLREQMQMAAAFMTQRAGELAKPHWREVDELVRQGFVTKVTLGQLLPITPDFRALELEWREEVFNQQGLHVLDRSGKYKVILNVAVVPVTEIKGEQQARNILGIFITDFSWRKITL